MTPELVLRMIIGQLKEIHNSMTLDVVNNLVKPVEGRAPKNRKVQDQQLLPVNRNTPKKVYAEFHVTKLEGNEYAVDEFTRLETMINSLEDELNKQDAVALRQEEED